MKLLKRTWANVSLDNLSHNYRLLRGGVPSACKFLGVVKADAYGHGAVPISHYLKDLGAEFLAVSNFEEALQIRRAEVRLPLLILGYTPPVYAEDMASMDIRQEVHSLEYARALSTALEGTDRRLKVHLKLDTGMSRLGFFAYGEPKTLDEILLAAKLPHLCFEGVFTHFPNADSLAPEDEAATRAQFARFTAMLDALGASGVTFPIRHCCNSAAAMRYPEFALDMIRPGIATYGVSPSPELRGLMDLKPLMSLHTTVSQVRDFPEGIPVSYGGAYVTPGPRRIAVLCIGYADGLSRSLSGRLRFLLRGKAVPVVGRICMDMCMVDVTEVPEVRAGDVATVFGTDPAKGPVVEDLAGMLNTIPYEILCDINKRIPRIYLDGRDQIEVLQYIV